MANKISAEWVVPPSVAFPAMYDEWRRRVYAAVLAIMESYKPRAESWMKQNAPWMDRTGNARQSLFTDIETQAQEVVSLIFAHGVDYGVFLEFKNQGRFAVIAPALDYFFPQIMADIQAVLR